MQKANTINLRITFRFLSISDTYPRTIERSISIITLDTNLKEWIAAGKMSAIPGQKD
jgi:hypothetical protein